MKLAGIGEAQVANLLSAVGMTGAALGAIVRADYRELYEGYVARGRALVRSNRTLQHNIGTEVTDLTTWH